MTDQCTHTMSISSSVNTSSGLVLRSALTLVRAGLLIWPAGGGWWTRSWRSITSISCLITSSA